MDNENNNMPNKKHMDQPVNNNQQPYQGMPQDPNMQGTPNMNQGQYNPNMNSQQPYQCQFQGQMPNQGQMPPYMNQGQYNQGQFNNQQAYQGQYQGMPQNPNMQGNPNMNQGQYNPNMNGQQPYQGQFQGQMPNQGQMPPYMNQGQYNQGQFNNQQAYQGQYQGMPQNPNMMNPQFQGYNQGKAPSKLGFKLKELGMKIKQDKKMAIISAVVAVIILVGGYLYHTRYYRALANHEFYVTFYDKNGKEDDELIWQFRKKDFRLKSTFDGDKYEGGYINKYKVDGNKYTLSNKLDAKAPKSKAIISKSGKDIKLTYKNGSYALLRKIK